MKININTPFDLHLKRIITLSRKINEDLNLTLSHLQYHILSDPDILKINQTYLNHDYLTDIITFDMRDDLSKEAEIFISLDRVIENAKIHKVSEEEELSRVCIHGLLHLSGMNDKTKNDKTKMREMENFYLKKLFHVKP